VITIAFRASVGAAGAVVFAAEVVGRVGDVELEIESPVVVVCATAGDAAAKAQIAMNETLLRSRRVESPCTFENGISRSQSLVALTIAQPALSKAMHNPA
jgi:hypothetical protein